MIKRKNGKKKGFSLIELIIVLAVMAIIALIAIPNLNSVKDKSKEKADNESCVTIERTVRTLLAGDVVKTEEVKGEYTVEFDNDGKSVVKKTGDNETVDAEITKALGDVKKPNKGTKFTININETGEVEAKVA